MRNRHNLKFFLQLVDIENFNRKSEYDIVACLKYSDLAPYIVFMERDQQADIQSKICSLVARVSNIGFKALSEGETSFPGNIRIAYLEAIKSFRRYFYDAEHFFKKIRILVVRLWKQMRAFKDFIAYQNSKQLVSQYAN